MQAHLDQKHNLMFEKLMESQLQGMRQIHKRTEEFESDSNKNLHSLEKNLNERLETLRLQLDFKLNKLDTKRNNSSAILDEIGRINEIITKNEDR